MNERKKPATTAKAIKSQPIPIGVGHEGVGERGDERTAGEG
jgi:hypothetical protein